MAVTVIPNLTNITLGLDSGDWTDTDGTDSEIFIQGTGSESWYVGKNTTPSVPFDAYGSNGNTTFDLSVTDTHLYFWVYSTVALLVGTKATGGLRLTIESATAQGAATDGTRYWNIAGSDTWDGRWTNFVVDVASSGDGSTGTLDLANIGTLIFYVNSAGTTYRSSPANYWIDAIRFGTGLAATGTTFDIGDISDTDYLTANKYGIVEETDGVYFVQGNIEIGDGTNTTQLDSLNETVAFRDQPVSSGLYGFVFSGAETNVTASTLSILSSGIDDNTRPNFDVDITVTAFTMNGSSINRGDFVVFNDDCVITTSVFNNCNTVTPGLAEFESNTVSTSNHIRALEVDSDSTTGMSSCNFLNNFSAATWYAYSGTYTDYSNHYDGNLYDVENSATGDLTINLNGTSDASSKYENPGTITLVSTTDFTLTNLQPDTEVRIYTSGTSSGTTTVGDELYGVESVTGSTTYQYGQDTITSGHNCIVMIHSVEYENIRLVLDLLGTDASIPIVQQLDRNYNNP